MSSESSFEQQENEVAIFLWEKVPYSRKKCRVASCY